MAFLAPSAALRSSSIAPPALPRRTQVHSICTRLSCVAVSESPSAMPSQSEPAPLVPRMCTLKELTFSEDGRLITKSTSQLPSRSSQLIELFLATVEASAQVKDLETLTGRFAMVTFFVAIAVEYMTGSGIFNSVDRAGLQQVMGLGLLMAVGAGAFAVARRGERNVTDILANGCQHLMDSTVDNLVDALFFEDGIVAHSPGEDKKSSGSS